MLYKHAIFSLAFLCPGYEKNYFFLPFIHHLLMPGAIKDIFLILLSLLTLKTTIHKNICPVRNIQTQTSLRVQMN